MSEPWSSRAAMYVDSDAHRDGPDLELIAEWAAGAATALDVATGGGHVAKRLRQEGISVVTCDPAPGMNPDVVCRAEDLPFDDASFDVVACRVAAHHFADVEKAVGEMARVTRDRLLIADTQFMGEDVEEAEKLRDPTHVRNYTEAEWRAMLDAAGLSVEDVRVTAKPMDRQAWLDRTGTTGETAERAIALLGDRITDEGIVFDRIVIRATKH
ncbi:MAG: class I SAM-dependent methyltransferase [Actinobacteria bacterium]|nr:class I SAM-dependent methyltransferase [Actinomycetota bacterium]